MSLTSQNKYFYIQLRSTSHHTIFRKDMDYQYFLQQLHYKTTEYNILPIAYCLLPHQIHLILEDNSKNTLSTMLKNLILRYNQFYFDKVHSEQEVISSIFSSDPFCQKKELLCRLRYLHQKPKASGTVHTLRYAYSSYSDYLTPNKRTMVYRNDIYKLFDREDFQKAANLLEGIHQEFETSYQDDSDELQYSHKVDTAKKILKEAITQYQITYNYFQKSSDLRDYLIIKISKKANLNQEEIAQLLNISRHIVGRVLRHNM